MKKQQLDHVLCAAGRITGEQQFVIVGSQSLHGKYPGLPDAIQLSAAVDLIAPQGLAQTELLNEIGVASPFHLEFGYYADPVDITTAALPRGWKGRLVNLPPGDTGGVKGLCLEPHDLAIAKYVARREKDMVFTRELARRGLLKRKTLLERLAETQLSDAVRSRVQDDISMDFRSE
jgi:uncharacterized nucleotidyltransferase DUF6036